MGLVKDYLDILQENGTYKIGIERLYYSKTLEKGGLDPEKGGLDPDYFGPILFKNYDDDDFLLIKQSIISLKTLKQTLINEGMITKQQDVPDSVKKIYQKSVPKKICSKV